MGSYRPNFILYIVGLLMVLQNAGYGCYIGYVFLSAWAYAEDLASLVPTPAAGNVQVV